MENPTPSPTISLDEIVEGYLSQHMLPSAQYRRIYQIAIRGFRLFMRDSLAVPITTTLDVLANNTAVLPVGAMNSISVGVLNQRGEFASLTYDPTLSTGQSTNPNRLEQQTYHELVNPNDIIFNLQDTLNVGYGYGGFGQYGIGSTGVIGFYNIDWQNRVMVFNFHRFCPNQIVFQYLGLPCEDGNYYIHPFFQEALIAYIAWQDSASGSGSKVALALRVSNKRDFDMQYNNARKAMTPFNPSDQYNVYREGARLSPKA